MDKRPENKNSATVTDIMIDRLVEAFWQNGGKEKYEASLEARRANGIPDRQWFAAQLMSLIDEADITIGE